MDTEALQELLDENLDQVEAALYGIGWKLTPRFDGEWRTIRCQRVCNQCGRRFEVDRPNRLGKFCSVGCAAKAPRDRHAKQREASKPWQMLDAKTA